MALARTQKEAPHSSHTLWALHQLQGTSTLRQANFSQIIKGEVLGCHTTIWCDGLRY